jgi:lipoprotein-anchoring transpeptidase ErfK/SrfK
MMRRVGRDPILALWRVGLVAAVLGLNACTTVDRRHRLVISVPEQKMFVFEEQKTVAAYPVSTSKFGLGDRPGSNATPTGRLEVAQKIGHNQPLGAVFKSRRPTGEIVQPNSPGRDPIVTRILWLRGLEPDNLNAFGRCIYIHGTPEESMIGKPASYGCIRMRSRDVAELFDRVGVGAKVEIVEQPVRPPSDPANGISISWAPPGATAGS